jgi:hypothetical protein
MRRIAGGAACLVAALACGIAAGAPAPQKPLPPGALLVVDGEGVTLRPAGAGRLRLELARVDPLATWFADRPGRSAGSAPVDLALRQILVSAKGRPNATLTLDAGGRLHEAAVEVLSARVVPGGRASLIVRPLDAAERPLPRRAREASLSIDDADESEGGFLLFSRRVCEVKVTNASTVPLSVYTVGRGKDDSAIGAKPPIPGNVRVNLRTDEALERDEVGRWLSRAASTTKGCHMAATLQPRGESPAVTLYIRLAWRYGRDPEPECLSSRSAWPCEATVERLGPAHARVVVRVRPR